MDKQKQIEEMAKVLDGDCGECYTCKYFESKGVNCTSLLGAEYLYEAGYRKIPEGAVVLTNEEYKRYARIEKIIKLAKMEKANGYEVKNGKLYYFSNMLEGCEIEFKDLQEICDMANHYNEEFWGLYQQLTFWKGKAEDIRKETAEKFAEMVSKAFVGLSCIDIDEWNWCQNKIDEICKEITEGKV